METLAKFLSPSDLTHNTSKGKVNNRYSNTEKSTTTGGLRKNWVEKTQ